jgi:hypothetical protein
VDFASPGTFELEVSLPDALLSRSCRDFRFTMHGVSSIHTNLDIAAIIDNSRSGNIADGKVFGPPESRLILTLVEGYLDILGSKLECVELPQRR